MRVRPFTVALVVAAFAFLISGYEQPGLWKGAIAVFLLWWADRDRRQVRASEQQAHLTAEHAPELAGKDVAQGAAYVLDAIEAFKREADASSRLKFAEALSEQQAQWALRGEPMPIWATLRLLRDHQANASHSQSDA